MARSRKPASTREAAPAVLSLPDEKKTLKRYFAGVSLPSPLGGRLEPARVRTLDDGSGVVILECTASSLRYELPVPAAKRSERQQVRRDQEEGRDPVCPRHGPGVRLERRGGRLVCPQCGVVYGRTA